MMPNDPDIINKATTKVWYCNASRQTRIYNQMTFIKCICGTLSKLWPENLRWIIVTYAGWTIFAVNGLIAYNHWLSGKSINHVNSLVGSQLKKRFFLLEPLSLDFDGIVCRGLIRLGPFGVIWLVWAPRREWKHPGLACFFFLFYAPMADVVIREMRREEQEWERAECECACIVNLYTPVYKSACHQVKQPEVWSNFLCGMEVVTALAHWSDWSLLVTMGWCDSVWGTVSRSRLSNQVGFRREDVFNQARSSYSVQVTRLWISWAAPCMLMSITDTRMHGWACACTNR